MNKSQKFEQQKRKHLIYSLALDAFGIASYMVPVLGEIGDAIYAPIYGAAIYYIYRKTSLPAAIGGIIGFAEELLPNTDIIPTATILWWYTYVYNKKNTFESFNH